MTQIKSKPKPSGRPNGFCIFLLALLTAGAVAGIAWLYTRQPDAAPPDSTFSSAVSPAELDAIPDGAGRDAYTLLSRAVRESLSGEDAREKFVEPIRGALDRILAVFGDEAQSGRARFDRAALFLTTLPYDSLVQFDPEYAEKLRAASEYVTARLAGEKIAEITARHHNRIDSKPVRTLAELKTALEKLEGEIAPIAPLLKKEEETGGIFSALNDIVKFLSERQNDEFAAEEFAPDEEETSDVSASWSEPGREAGAYAVRLKITEAIGRAEDQPAEITLLLDGNRLVGKFPVPADEALLKLPIRENLTLTVAETGEEFTLSADGNENLAPLGMPGVAAAEFSPLPDLNRAQIRLEIRQTYKLPQFLFDAVGRAGESFAHAPERIYPGPARTPSAP